MNVKHWPWIVLALCVAYFVWALETGPLASSRAAATVENPGI